LSFSLIISSGICSIVRESYIWDYSLSRHNPKQDRQNRQQLCSGLAQSHCVSIVADSAETTGLKWAAPAGGGKNFTLLNAGGTSLTGSSTTISGISAKDEIYILIPDSSTDTANAEIRLRINGDTGNNYNYCGQRTVALNTYGPTVFRQSGTIGDPAIQLCIMSATASSNFTVFAHIMGANSSGVKPIIYAGAASSEGSGNATAYNGGGMWTGSGSITSITILTGAGNFDSGTVYVYTSA
jgi:hypothetical protein